MDPAFKERVTAAFDGLAALLRAGRARAVALLEPLRAPDGSLRGIDVPGPANPSARPEAR